MRTSKKSIIDDLSYRHRLHAYGCIFVSRSSKRLISYSKEECEWPLIKIYQTWDLTRWIFIKNILLWNQMNFDFNDLICKKFIFFQIQSNVAEIIACHPIILTYLIGITFTPNLTSKSFLYCNMSFIIANRPIRLNNFLVMTNNSRKDIVIYTLFIIYNITQWIDITPGQQH